MATQTIGIIVNGATGRIGSTQHLANALVPIIDEGGLALGDDRLVPRLLLVGRDPARLAAVARACNGAPWSTDLAGALADPAYAVFFDAAATQQRVAVRQAHTGAAFRHRAQVELLTGLCAAPPEHAGVRSHSVEALAQLGQPRRDELHLRP